ncbi:hypothetical protein UFOVP1615_5 [uncultured Caudovirales phage]|uniref:Uncharacterized protein n=1 Tax=uncultured Caudovirales phage TaxID=2100421 RepID=A0A6J5SW90_9CAUD|nr:hypothetical protein UFOVP1615_5 [uncultured Caudovirales phage]
MKNYKVTGYQMVKNQNTWEMESIGELMTISVISAKNNVEMIEGNVANKMNFDWFEAVTISN